MKRHQQSPYRVFALLLLGITAVMMGPQAQVLAQAPTPDPYEPNNALVEAAAIPVGAELGNLSISPAGDSDWFRALIRPAYGYPGSYRAEVVGTPGLDLTLTVYGPDALPVASHNDPNSANAGVSFQVSTEGYYAIEVSNNTGTEGWYLLRLRDLTPAPTPIPTGTATLLPTATSPFPTNTPTPALGGPPDTAEPNYDFRHAYRIVPGDVLENLNFNPGVHGTKDNDFFVMAVRAGIRYRCETRDLGPSVDTNLIAYGSADFNDLIGGNDDIDTQAGQINSRLTFTAGREGDIYLLVGYKYPETEDIPFPGAATYTLACYADAATATPPPSAGLPWNLTPQATALRVEVVERPEGPPTTIPVLALPQTIDVLVGYDRNDNRAVDPDEGVRDLSVRVLDAGTNRELSQGTTDSSGAVRFTLVTRATVRVVIPFLGASREFRPGSAAAWTILIPAANAPGLIP